MTYAKASRIALGDSLGKPMYSGQTLDVALCSLDGLHDWGDRRGGSVPVTSRPVALAHMSTFRQTPVFTPVREAAPRLKLLNGHH